MTKLNGEVSCPVHGTHGNLSNGKCWWCVQAGVISAQPVSRRILFQDTVNPRVPGSVRIIR